MNRIEANADPEIDALGMDKTVTGIEIRLKGGRVFQGRFSRPYRGGPDSPFSKEELIEKFNDCVRPVLAPKRAATLRKTVESLEDLASLRTLARMAGAP
jgi:2-methylcitrate dehydratase PrpD